MLESNVRIHFICHHIIKLHAIYKQTQTLLPHTIILLSYQISHTTTQFQILPANVELHFLLYAI